MNRHRPQALGSRLFAIIMLATLPCELSAQTRAVAPSPASVVVLPREWGEALRMLPPRVLVPAYPAQETRSAARTIATHTVVGAGAGLLIGLILSGTSQSNDQLTVIVTWTALGAGAGAVSGVVTWLAGRAR